MTLVPFHNADEVGNRFLALLSKHSIDPPSGAELEDELLSLTNLMEVAKKPSLAQGSKAIDILRAAAGLYDFAAKVLSVETHAEFETFVPHLCLIAKKEVRAASLAQTAASGPYDDTARKMAELYMACLAAHVGTDVYLDSPTSAKGDNPDVIFKYEPSRLITQPQQWALAIKTISSRHGQTIFDRIKEGAEQIDNQNCPAKRGMVVINAKSALDHNKLWESVYPDLSAAMNALSAELSDLAESAAFNRPLIEWDRLFTGKVARPVLFLGQSLVRLDTPAGEKTPAILKMLLAYEAKGVVDQVATELAVAMNHFMQDVLRGSPGRPGQLPQ